MYQPQHFKTVKDVYEYLIKSDFDIKKATIYYHKKVGKLVPDENGEFPIFNVNEYITNWLGAKSSERVILNPETGKVDQTSKNIRDYRAEKTKADTEKALAQAEHWVTKTNILTGKYIERSEFETELSQRAAILKQDFLNFFRTRAGDMAALVSGEVTKVPDLISYGEREVEKWLNRYAEPGKDW